MAELTFQSLISRFCVDEAHSFHTAGFTLYGLSAFRPSWGKIPKLKASLRPSVPWHLFLATFPATYSRLTQGRTAQFNEAVYWGRVRRIAKSEGLKESRNATPKVRIDIVAYNRKRQTMPSDRRSDKGLPTISNSVLPVLYRGSPLGFLFPGPVTGLEKISTWFKPRPVKYQIRTSLCIRSDTMWKWFFLARSVKFDVLNRI